MCVLVNTFQYHDTVDFIKDSETKDPQLVAEPGVGRNHGVWTGCTSKFLSANLGAHTYRQWKRDLRLWQATSSLQKNRQEGWLLRQLKGESRTAAEVVMDDALVQEDGIDLIVGELDRCCEVTQDKTKHRRSKRPSSRHRGTSKWKRPSCPTWHGGSLTFNNKKMHWGRRYQQ